MSDGRTHTLVNVASTVCLSLIVCACGVPGTSPGLGCAVAGALFGTLLVTPDLDMIAVRTDPRRHWGPLAFLWIPLLLVSRHRGVSHTWLRGPLIRAAYLAVTLTLLGSLVWWAAAHLLPAGSAQGLLDTLSSSGPVRGLRETWTAWTVGVRPAELWSWAALGYWLAQVSHLLLDRIPLHWKRL